MLPRALCNVGVLCTHRSILKEIRGLTLSNSRVFLLEEPDHRKWGHGQFVENSTQVFTLPTYFSCRIRTDVSKLLSLQVDVLLGMLPLRAGALVLDWAMTNNAKGNFMHECRRVLSEN
jgi:hypothetical protein